MELTVKTMKKAPAQLDVPSQVGQRLNDLMRSLDDQREYEMALREAKYKVEDAKREAVKVLVEYNMYDCLSINMNAIRKMSM